LVVLQVNSEDRKKGGSESLDRVARSPCCNEIEFLMESRLLGAGSAGGLFE